MSTVDTSPYQEQFDAFLQGEPIYSPEPQEIGRFAQEDINLLKYYSALDVRYPITNFRYLPGDISRHFQRITNYFLDLVCKDNYRLDYRFGYFYLNDFFKHGVDVFHLDTAQDGPDIDPVVISSVTIGTPTDVVIGRVKRDLARKDEAIVDIVDGIIKPLEEGVIYTFSPFTAHRQPTAPLVGENRFWWRHFH